MSTLTVLFDADDLEDEVTIEVAIQNGNISEALLCAWTDALKRVSQVPSEEVKELKENLGPSYSQDDLLELNHDFIDHDGTSQTLTITQYFLQ